MLWARMRALIGYSFLLAEMGHARDALRPAERAVAIDPLNPQALAVLGNAYYFGREYETAIGWFRPAIGMAPDRFYVRYYIGLSQMWLGHLQEARQEFAAMPAGDLFRNAGEAVLGARAEDRVLSDPATAVVKKQDATMLLAGIYAQRGEPARAFQLIDAAWAIRGPDLSALCTDPLYDPLRPDPRFKALLAKLRFP